MELRRIGRHDRDWHDRFFGHLKAIFGLGNFAGWERLGGWSDRYDVLALTEGEEICATVGVTRMEGWLDKRQPIPLRQLGAVATRPQDRGRGLARRLLEHVLVEADREGTPVLLFANPSVVDFYPRFGFRRLIPDHLSLDLPPGGKAQGGIGRRLDPETPQDRALLATWCDRALVHGGALSARSDASVLLWHLMNTDVTAHELPEGRGLAFVERTEDGLMLCDWLSRDGRPDFSLIELLAGPQGGRVALGFVPGDVSLLNGLRRTPWPEACMFWRGPVLPQGILHFPALMMT